MLYTTKVAVARASPRYRRIRHHLASSAKPPFDPYIRDASHQVPTVLILAAQSNFCSLLPEQTQPPDPEMNAHIGVQSKSICASKAASSTLLHEMLEGLCSIVLQLSKND